MTRETSSKPADRSVFAARRERLLAALRTLGVESMLVTNFVNVRYLSGFTGDDSYLLIDGERAVVLSDSRYEEQLSQECPDLTLEIRRTPVTLMQLLARNGAGLRRMALEADSVTLATYEGLRAALPEVEWIPTRGMVEGLRAVKDAAELASIREAVRLAEEAMGALRGLLRGDQTERQAAAELEYQIRRRGGEGCAFAPIIASGPRAALPHARPTNHLVSEGGLLLLDWGAVAEGYRSDLTRVWPTARITPELETVYEVVLNAQERAIAAIRPGALLSEVDAVARRTIADAGYGDRFGHGLGHGFGLEIHEQPRMAPDQHRPLEVGMVVTVEPGIYLPGWGGVRIEDDVLVGPDGAELLTSFPKGLADGALSL